MLQIRRAPNKRLEVTEARCSECSAVGHRWTECKSQVKKCLNCQGPHRTLAMACPKKKEAIKNKREREMRQGGRMYR